MQNHKQENTDLRKLYLKEQCAKCCCCGCGMHLSVLDSRRTTPFPNARDTFFFFCFFCQVQCNRWFMLCRNSPEVNVVARVLG